MKTKLPLEWEESGLLLLWCLHDALCFGLYDVRRQLSSLQKNFSMQNLDPVPKTKAMY